MEVVLREKGRITIPASIRRAIGLRVGDRLEISVERMCIVLRPRRVVKAKDLRGVIGPMRVEMEEIEEALGRVQG